MPKPLPKREITVMNLVVMLNIYPATNDAKEWMLKHAPDFGVLECDPLDRPNCWVLTVDPNYDIDEVAEYIRNMGD